MTDKKVQIGLSDETISQINKLLRTTIWDVTVVYTTLKQFHRNVRWIHFSEYHELFETMSTALLPIIDNTAERIRALGKDAPWTMSEFIADADLSETENKPIKIDEMITILLNQYESMIRTTRESIKTCAKLWDDGNTDFLTWIMEQFEKTARMLRATIS